MRRHYVFIKDGFLTVTVIGLFCFLFLVADANQYDHNELSRLQSTKDMTADSMNIDEFEQRAYTVRRAAVPHTNDAASIDAHGSTSSESVSIKSDQPAELAISKIPPVQKVSTKTADVTSVPTASNVPITVDAELKIDTQAFIEKLSALIEQETNVFRKRHDLLPLQKDVSLAQNAREYSYEMLTGDFFAHTNNSGCDITCRFNKSGHAVTAWGENLAVIHFHTLPSAQEVATYFMNEWQKSAGHRDNLLSPQFTHQGIGIAFDESSVYVTEHFARPN